MPVLETCVFKIGDVVRYTAAGNKYEKSVWVAIIPTASLGVVIDLVEMGGAGSRSRAQQSVWWVEVKFFVDLTTTRILPTEYLEKVEGGSDDA